ncbi:MAG: heparan-alpha-glucosaminide N-acetyltransferase [Pseudomonadota bacterium]
MATPRLPLIDIARTGAIVGMVIYHFVYDLGLFGVIPGDVAVNGFWKYLARGVAGTFLFLAGFSLVLAHGKGIRWSAFWRRFALVGGAALLVTVGTWLAMRGVFVYFGILHCIAISSLVAVAFVRLPAIFAALGALAIWAVVFVWPNGIFEAVWLSWLGISTVTRPSIDLVPLLPWLAPCLLGVACAKWAAQTGVLREYLPDTRFVRAVGWPGQHSLVIYLIHQPILMGLIWATRYLMGV